MYLRVVERQSKPNCIFIELFLLKDFLIEGEMYEIVLLQLLSVNILISSAFSAIPIGRLFTANELDKSQIHTQIHDKEIIRHKQYFYFHLFVF